MMVRLLIVTCFLWQLLPVWPVGASVKPDQLEQEEVVAFLRQLYQVRTQTMIKGRFAELEPYYLQQEKTSAHALHQEKYRSHYMLAWAQKRNIVLTDAESDIRIGRLSIKDDLARVSLVHSQKVTYSYPLGGNPQWFGVGTRHALTLKKVDHQWVVLKEWYLDPFEEKVELIPDSGKRFPMWIREDQDARHSESSASKRTTRYNRQKAVEYALKYAGAAWGAGNNGRYNKAYRDYTGVGGDCTNFTSQAVGDKEEGGGLQMSSGWRYWKGSGGSHSWVQTDRFYHFLLHSGQGQLVGSGKFLEITEPDAKHPHGALAQLQPGDLIAYVMHGNDIDHFSVVVGHDDFGYPLVNSHTADRYRMPFDLGWDRETRYMLIHIRD